MANRNKKHRKSYRFTIPVAPKTKQAVRFTKKGRAFQPQGVVDFENSVKEFCAEYMQKQNVAQLTQPLRVNIKLRKNSIGVTLTHIDDPDQYKTEVRGDVDNYAKAILDGLQGEGGIIGNDRQVWELHISKHSKRK